MFSGAGCAKETRTGVMSTPVLSRASLSAIASANSVRAGCNGAVAVSWIKNRTLSSCGVCASPRDRSPAAHSAQDDQPFSREGLDRRVLDEVQRAAGQRLGEMHAKRFVARQGRREPPRSLGDRLGNRMFGSSSLVRPSRRIGAALTWRPSTHAMRWGRTHPCTNRSAITARLCLLPITSDGSVASARHSNRITSPNNTSPHIPQRWSNRGRLARHGLQEYASAPSRRVRSSPQSQSPTGDSDCATDGSSHVRVAKRTGLHTFKECKPTDQPRREWESCAPRWALTLLARWSGSGVAVYRWVRVCSLPLWRRQNVNLVVHE